MASEKCVCANEARALKQNFQVESSNFSSTLLQGSTLDDQLNDPGAFKSLPDEDDGGLHPGVTTLISCAVISLLVVLYIICNSRSSKSLSSSTVSATSSGEFYESRNQALLRPSSAHSTVDNSHFRYQTDSYHEVSETKSAGEKPVERKMGENVDFLESDAKEEFKGGDFEYGANRVPRISIEDV